MKETAQAFYADLAADYAVKIRQLVPKYDDMIRCMIGVLDLGAPEAVLDLGAGIGEVSRRVVEALPRVHVTAVEVSDEMVRVARHLLQEAGRCAIVPQNILDYSPVEPFDAVLSSLVLHNLTLEEKRRLLETIPGWLRPGGIFVWGDLIRYSDPRVQAHFVRQRMDFARAAGCSSALVRDNFDKEETADFPLTVEETRRVATTSGFSDFQLVWLHDTFAVFVMRNA